MVNVVTHSEDFHADDIFAVATLKILHNGDINIIRSRNDDIISQGEYVVDVGGIYDPLLKRFDHHQKGGAGVRENGIPYASFGLVWKEYGQTLCERKDIADFIDMRLVQAIDGPDNGVVIAKNLYSELSLPTIQSIIMLFRPTWREDASEIQLYSRFIQFVDLAEIYLRRFIEATKDYIEGKECVVEAYEEAPDKRIIVLDRSYPFQEVLEEFSEPLYVLYPRKEGGWGVKAVRINQESFENRKDLPESWAGKMGEELKNATGVPEAVFCHNKRFLITAQTKEGALKLAQKAVTE